MARRHPTGELRIAPPGGDEGVAPQDATTVSVVVPVYNGAGTLESLVERLSAVLDAATAEYEIILVDDGSADDSWATICRLSEEHPRLRGLGLMRNYGQHNALLAGIRQAGHDVIVTLDDDLQNPPEELPKLLERLAAGADVVYGKPMQKAHGLGRRLSSRLMRLILKEAMGARGAEMVSPFRAFHSELREGFAEARGPAVNVDVLLSWSTGRFDSVPVRHDERTVGHSNYTVGRLVRHAFNLLTGFSTQPLRIASMTGFFFTLVGMAIFGYVIARYVQTGGVVHGFAFLASIICVFAGAQLFTIGVIGEYMARMYHRMMERPSYTVGRVTPEAPADSPAGRAPGLRSSAQEPSSASP